MPTDHALINLKMSGTEQLNVGVDGAIIAHMPVGRARPKRVFSVYVVYSGIQRHHQTNRGPVFSPHAHTQAAHIDFRGLLQHIYVEFTIQYPFVNLAKTCLPSGASNAPPELRVT